METSGRFSATRVIPLAVTIENARLALKGYLSPKLAAVITLFVWISSVATWPSVERMLLVTLAVAIENARLTMKRHLLTLLTAVITVFVLICSFTVWPSVERALLVRMTGGGIESVNDEKLPVNLSLKMRRSRHVEIGF